MYVRLRREENLIALEMKKCRHHACEELRTASLSPARNVCFAPDNGMRSSRVFLLSGAKQTAGRLVEGSGAEKESSGAEKGGGKNGGRGFGEGQGELHSNTSIDRHHRAGREKCGAHHPVSRADARDVGMSKAYCAIADGLSLPPGRASWTGCPLGDRDNNAYFVPDNRIQFGQTATGVRNEPLHLQE